MAISKMEIAQKHFKHMKGAITLLIGIAMINFGCLTIGWLARGWLSPPPPACEATAIVRDTIKGDSVPYEVIVPVPSVRYVSLPPDTVFREVDTAAILLAYFATRYYSDTLMNDTSAFIVLDEAVRQSSITGRQLLFQNRRPTYITTTMIQPQPQVEVYVAMFAGKELAAPVVQVEWRKWQFSAGYNLSGGGVVGGIGYRVR
jgi:hypothetical protein